MSKETSRVMEMVREIMRAESEVVLKDVQAIIRAQDETSKAISTVMAVLKESCI